MKEETFDETVAIGMMVADATEFFKQYGYTVRVTRKNGSAVICTRDYRVDRVNIGIEKDVVTEIRGIG